MHKHQWNFFLKIFIGGIYGNNYTATDIKTWMGKDTHISYPCPNINIYQWIDIVHCHVYVTGAKGAEAYSLPAMLSTMTSSVINTRT